MVKQFQRAIQTMNNRTKHHLLYVYKKRVPKELRNLVLSFIPQDKFEIKMMEYDESDHEKIEKLQWAEVVLFAPGRFFSDNIMANCKHIKLMQLWSSGYDKFNLESAKKYKIPVANNGGGNAISVSEHAVMLMLAVYKWLPDSHWRTVTGNWAGNSHGMDMFTLIGKTLGIVGFGNIGREVAKRVSGFDMKVFTFSKSFEARKKNYPDIISLDLKELISSSDIISFHCKLPTDGKPIINKNELHMMKKNTVIINTARGNLINEVDLKEALDNSVILGAAIDVYSEEPAKNNILFGTKNLILTPHIAASTVEAQLVVAKQIAEQVSEFFNSGKVINPV